MGFFDLLQLLIWRLAKGRGVPPYRIEAAQSYVGGHAAAQTHVAGVTTDSDRLPAGVADGRSE